LQGGFGEKSLNFNNARTNLSKSRSPSHDGKIKPSIAFMLLPRDQAKFDKFVDLTDEASPLQTMGGCSEPVTMRVFGSERQQHDAKRDSSVA
jgi:hypothetical protein